MHSKGFQERIPSIQPRYSQYIHTSATDERHYLAAPGGLSTAIDHGHVCQYTHVPPMNANLCGDESRNMLQYGQDRIYHHLPTETTMPLFHESHCNYSNVY